MPPDRVALNVAREWMRYAHSDFQLLHANPPEGVLLETLIFHAQQAVEKAFKAVLTFHGVDFPATHNLNVLRERLPVDLILPSMVADATALSVYAVAARYPQDDSEITGDDYHAAVKQAEAVVDWATKIIEQNASRSA